MVPPFRGPVALADDCGTVAECGDILELGDVFGDRAEDGPTDAERMRVLGASRLEGDGREMMSIRGQLPRGGGETYAVLVTAREA